VNKGGGIDDERGTIHADHILSVADRPVCVGSSYDSRRAVLRVRRNLPGEWSGAMSIFTKWWEKILSWFGGGKPKLTKCPPSGAPGTLRGISVDYNWLGVDYGDFFERLAQNGCNATSIEFFGWSTTYDLAQGLEPLKVKYQAALAATRAHGGMLFVSLCNDNQGSGKYGDRRKRWSRMGNMPDQALDYIISCGPANVIVQPVSEGQTSWGKSWELSAIAKLNGAGFVTCWNRGSRPTSPGAGANRNAYHPFKTSDVGTPEDIIVTDTGTILTVLTEGGIYGNSLRDSAVAQYAAAVRRAGNRDLLIYTFTGLHDVDSAEMAAVGNAWQ